jgi:uncharacterized protein YcaQ
MLITLEDLRRLAVARSLFKPTTLKRALHKMGFVQADPIRAPARAQDLILRHRVKDYRAGDLERLYAKLGIEEDYFVTYGFVTKSIQALMHPRSDTSVPAGDYQPWPPARRKQAKLLLEFVRERGAVNPRDVDNHFAHGTVKNYWGGSSNATTQLLDDMHYRGLLRVARREGGIRIYAEHQHGLGPTDEAERRARIDALVDVLVRIYAPLPGRSLAFYLRRLRFAMPQWRDELTSALQRAKQRLSHARTGSTLPHYTTDLMRLRRDEVDWYWPADEDAMGHMAPGTVRFLAPFDPVVHDRTRFELLWGWVYRFEAYTPAPKRKLGYYALPLLWRDRVIGWTNLSMKNGELKSEFGYVASRAPRDRAFKRELEAELDRIRAFLGLES